MLNRMYFFQALNNQIDPFGCNDKTLLKWKRVFFCPECFANIFYHLVSVMHLDVFCILRCSVFYTVEEHLSGDLH